MKLLLAVVAVFFAVVAPAAAEISDDEKAVRATIDAVVSAFARGDVEGVVSHFHPGVIQIPSFDKILIGQDATRANYVAAFEAADFEFVNNDIENLEVFGDSAVYHATYTLRITSKAGGEAVDRSGRYMIVMRRHEGSPTGWATYRELVQPQPTE